MAMSFSFQPFFAVSVALESELWKTLKTSETSGNIFNKKQ